MVNKIIEDYLKAIDRAVSNGGPIEFWPFAPGQVDSYFIDVISMNLFDKFKVDKSKFKAAITLLEVNVIRWYLLPFVILGLKLAEKYEGYFFDRNKCLEFVEVCWETLKDKTYSDPFNLDNKNLLYSSDEIKNIGINLHWFDGRNKKIINFLSMDIESYVWSIDFDLYAYGVTWHGPYEYKEGILLVKKFYDLNSEVWEVDNFPSTVEIFFLFNRIGDVKIDFMGHINYKKNIWNNLLKYAIVIDGHSIKSEDQLPALSDKFSLARENQVNLINNLSSMDIIKKATELYYYLLRPIFQFYGEDWQPPKFLMERIAKEGLKYWNEFSHQPVDDSRPGKNFVRKLYDPRNNFTG